ncbi:hypothetical protein ACTFIT_000129 [Dictyostelium discoideum]
MEVRGYQCEQKPLKCSSDCSNNDGGICNNINGKCECNENRIFDDCSGRLCNEGLGCSNGGICDYLFGQCNCTIQWTASNLNQIECDIVADSDYMVECYPSDIYCDQYNNNNLELSVVQNNVHWSGFYNPTPLDGVSVCINNGSISSSNSSSNSSGNDINDKKNFTELEETDIKF